MNRLWIAKAIVEGRTVYISDTAGVTRSECQQKIWFTAKKEGFKGTVDERLQELGWTIVELEVKEVTPE